MNTQDFILQAFNYGHRGVRRCYTRPQFWVSIHPKRSPTLRRFHVLFEGYADDVPNPEDIEAYVQAAKDQGFTLTHLGTEQQGQAQRYEVTKPWRGE